MALTLTKHLKLVEVMLGKDVKFEASAEFSISE